jgi:hypothetical protein
MDDDAEPTVYRAERERPPVGGIWMSQHRHIAKGSRQVQGWVLPVSGSDREQLLLETAEGRKLRFFYENHAGSIVVSGEDLQG